MERDRGPERIRLEIRTNRSVSVTFLGEERTRVESNDVYVRSDEHARVLTQLGKCQNELSVSCGTIILSG